ncbi:MAG: hypothetical protein PHU85_12010, partial [Phycisphaerae bacterium]|nr:hypothetical protein [Phycisphaerae bacterium]
MSKTKKTGPVSDPIIDQRAMVAGAILFGLLIAGGVAWRLSAPTQTVPKLREFEFSIAEPMAEKFELSEPRRQVFVERPEQISSPQATAIKSDEMPDIHITRVPTEATSSDVVIQSRNTTIDTPRIDLSAVAPDGKGAVELPDAPEQIARTSETVTWGIKPIAVDAVAPADYFKYKEPTPKGEMRLYTMNSAPAPRRAMTVMPKAFGDQDAPSMGKLGPANVNLFGTGDFLRTMSDFGGVKAVAAVDSALHWLAVNQEPGGMWSAKKHDGEANADKADTGLALLALMSGGHTIRKGEYRRNVLRGLEELIRIQKPGGEFDTNMYTHAICTIALCEAYGRARDERVGAAARKAVGYLEKAVNPDGGWRYTANCGLSDMSVSGWCIMALKTAKLADIRFDNNVYAQALSFVDSVTDAGGGQETNGVVAYMFVQGQRYETNDRPALTAAGMMVRQFSGVGVKARVLEKGAGLNRLLPPDWAAKDFYYWYYATYAMHNMGGEQRLWWNSRIRDVLLTNQAHDGDNAGSWDPKGDKWAARGAGRVYTTALGALCL